MVFPNREIHGEIIVIHRRVDLCVPTTLIGATAVFAYVYARWVNREGQVTVERVFGGEDPGIPFACSYGFPLCHGIRDRGDVFGR